MGCRVGNRSSHRRSFRVRNDLPEWENTDRPAMRSSLCNILAASSGRRGERGRPVINKFEGTGVVLGGQLTRGIINTVLAVAKVAFAYEFPPQMKANTPLLVTFPSDPTFRESLFIRLYLLALTEDWHIDIESGVLEGPRLKKVLDDPSLHCRED